MIFDSVDNILCANSAVVVEELEFLVLVVDDLEEEHPAELANPLGIAVDADVPPMMSWIDLTRLRTDMGIATD